MYRKYGSTNIDYFVEFSGVIHYRYNGVCQICFPLICNLLLAGFIIIMVIWEVEAFYNFFLENIVAICSITH